MRVAVIIVLVAILMSVLLPPALPLLALRSNAQSIGELDVCHSAAPALSSGGDMPCLGECSCRPVPPVIVRSAYTCTPVFVQTVYSTQNERPPKA